MPNGQNGESNDAGRNSMVRVLGEVALQIGPEVVAVPGRLLRRILLRLLVADGRPVSASALSEDVWGEMVPTETIRVQLSRLRRVVTPLNIAVVGSGGGWVLSCDPDQIDSKVFANRVELALTSTEPETVLDACAHALSLIRGRVLGDVADEHWARAEADRLDSLRIAATQRWAETLLFCGRTEESIGVFNQLAIERPYDERCTAWLSIARGVRGDRSEGLETLGRFRRRLRDDLGLLPGPMFDSVESALLDDNRSPLDALETTYPLDRKLVASLRYGPMTDPHYEPDKALVGRRLETEALLNGRPGLAVSLVIGEEGIGKSAIAREVAQGFRNRQAVVLHGQCTEDSGIAFEPLVEATMNSFDPDAVAARSVLLGPPWEPMVEDVRTSPISTIAEYVGQQLAGFVREVSARRQLLVVIEDVHWASVSSLRAMTSWLVELSRQARLSEGKNQVHVLFTHRFVRRSSTAFERFSETVLRVEGSLQIELRPLDRASVGSLIANCGVANSPALLDSVFACTAGNPLYVREIARELTRREDSETLAFEVSQLVPLKVETLTKSRISRLSSRAKEVLFFTACAGGRLPHRFLRGMFESDETYFNAIDDCLAADLLTDNVNADALEFRHGYFERVTLSLLPIARRQRMHASLGNAMRLDEKHVEETAHHFARAGDFVRRELVVEAGLAAANFAYRAGAFDNAQQHVARCLALVRTDDAGATQVHLLAALVAVARADLETAKAHAVLMIRTSLRDRDSETAIRGMAIHASYGKRGSVDRESLTLLSVLEDFPDRDSNIQNMVPIIRHEHQSMWGADGSLTRGPAEICFAEIEKRAAPELVGVASYLVSMAELSSNDLIRRSALVASLERSAQLSGNNANAGRAIRLRGLIAMQRGDRSTLEELIHVAEKYSTVPGVWYLGTDASRWKAALAMADGSWGEATRWIDENDQRSFGMQTYLETGEAQRALVAFRLGLLRGNEPALASLRTNVVVRASVEGLIGMCAIHGGDRQTGRAQLQKLLAQSTEDFQHRNHLADLAFLASLVDELEETDVARQVSVRFEPYAGQMAITGAGEFVLGAIDRYRGIVASLAGAHDHASGLFERARAFEENWPVPHVETTLAMARASARAGRREVAIRQANEGLSDAERLGLPTLGAAFRSICSTVVEPVIVW
jgi:DNA-binding SARP family transcriptional activator